MSGWSRDPGGTPGGIGEFVVGVLLGGVGLWLLMSRVMVTSRHFFGGFFGGMGEGGALAVILVPFALGVAGLFYRGRSWWAWGCVLLSLALMVLQIITSLELIFAPTSLPVFLGMVTMVFAGVGLVARSLTDHSRR